MPTIRLDMAYDGSGFRGYAKQDQVRTVQGELERVLALLLGSTPTTAVAGRTDAGVHALGQVVSFGVDEEPELPRLLRSLNGMLNPEISVLGASVVDDHFNARYSARWRRYRYLFDTGPAINPLTRGHSWHVGPDLDWKAMAHCVGFYVGEHDFGSFCRSVEGKSNIRRVESADLILDDGKAEFWVTANAFCHQMVRSLVGLIYDVGRGFTDGSTVPSIMEARDRSQIATVAPPQGLTLWEVGY